MKKLALISILILTFSLFAGCSAEKDVLITSQSSPDGNYTVSLYQVGEPQWSFGDVKARLILENSDGQILDEESFELANDGGNVTADNITDIIWSEDYVEIHIREFDTTRQYTHILNYNK